MTQTYEWSHPVHIRELDGPKTYVFAADEGQKKALAQRAGVSSILELAATVTVDPNRLPGRFEALGKVIGKVEYTCIRTGKPFVDTVEGEIEGVYADRGDTVSFAKARKKRAEEFGDEPNFLDESDDPEPLEEGGYIELGELAAQEFILALDPYPLSPDAPAANYGDTGEPVAVENPFAVLGQLRNFMAEDDN